MSSSEPPMLITFVSLRLGFDGRSLPRRPATGWERMTDMADFGIDVDPGEVGLDEQRLQRIDTHFRRYVDDGRLPG